MLSKLPGWVVDNATSVRREAEPYRTMTPEQRASLVRSACRDAMTVMAMKEPTLRAKLFAWRDEVPASTERALARLREQERGRKR